MGLAAANLHHINAMLLRNEPTTVTHEVAQALVLACRETVRLLAGSIDCGLGIMSLESLPGEVINY